MYCEKFYLLQAEDMEQLAVKFLVEGVDVIGERLLEEMRGGENLVEADEFLVVRKSP